MRSSEDSSNYNGNNKLSKNTLTNQNKNNQQKLPYLNNRNNWNESVKSKNSAELTPSTNPSNNNNNSNAIKKKLYTFQDFINSKKNINNNNIKSLENLNNANQKNLAKKSQAFEIPNSSYNNNNNNNNNRNKQKQLQSSLQDFKEIRILNTPEYTHRSISPLPEPRYITMPISSGFGGYTGGTTRRKNPPKLPVIVVPKSKSSQDSYGLVKEYYRIKQRQEKVLTVSPRKPVKIQPLYRVNSEDDMMSNNRTIVYEDDEPEEEVVHVVHRARPKPKEKIIYVDEDPTTQRQNVVYVDRPASPQYVYASKQPQIVYAQQTQSQPQIIYAQPQQQQAHQIVYASPPTRAAPSMQASQPQYVYLDSNGAVTQQPQVQYVVQQEPQYIQQMVQPQQTLQYYDPNASNVVYVNEPASNMVTTVPANNIIYR